MNKKILAMCMGVVIVSCSFLCSRGIKSNMQQDYSENQQHDVINDKGEGLISDTVYPIPQNLVFSNPSKSSALAAEGITIQAITEPVVSNYIKLEWTAYFLDSSSLYAQENCVEDFIRFTPQHDQCTIVCLEAFSEPIMVRCSATYQPTIFAECRLDYEKRINERKLEFATGNCLEENDLYYVNFNDELIYSFANNSPSNTIYGEGTVLGSENNQYYYNLSNELEQYLLNETDLYGYTTYAKRTAIDQWDVSINEIFEKIGASPENVDLFEELMYEAIPNFISKYPDTPLFYIELECMGIHIKQTFTYRIAALSWRYSPKLGSIKFNCESLIF